MYEQITAMESDADPQQFTYEVLRHEWVAQIGYHDQYGNPQSRAPYWTSEPFNTQAGATTALEAHEEVIQWSDRLQRYEMQKSYTYGMVMFRKTSQHEYDR
jgi:hypothetical protein